MFKCCGSTTVLKYISSLTVQSIDESVVQEQYTDLSLRSNEAVCVCTCTCRTDVNVLASSATPPMYRALVNIGGLSFSSWISITTLAVLARRDTGMTHYYTHEDYIVLSTDVKHEKNYQIKSEQ